MGYSLANLALRYLSDIHSGGGWDLWVTAMKAGPAAVAAWILVTRRAMLGQPALPTRRILPVLGLAALIMQLGGNLMFQVALGYIGLGITVPLVFSCILCVGALLGRVVLNDGLGPHILVSMYVMFLAICMLSAGTMTDAEAVTSGADGTETARVFTGILVALISGCSYGTTGVLIRYLVRDTLPVESTFIVFSTSGLVLLGLPAIYLAGWETIQAGTLREWPALLAAGVANAVAFFALAHAYRFMNVNRLNVINASQNAMCAVGAVVVFNERLSLLAICGIAMTVVGLLTASGSKT